MRLHRPIALAALLLVLAVALRCWDWGDPVIHVDEQYYLLVADRMWAGAVPYVDIWDRKPIGLFLLYAAFHLLPGNGILAYQVAATLAAAATALLVHAGARTLGARHSGALAAAVLYLLMLSVLGGRGGQAPVFYNLPVAAAGVLALRLPGRSLRGIVASGAAACLLVGLAIQMKYTPAVEGAFIGLAHGWALVRRGVRPGRLAGALLFWLLMGLLPTLAVIGWYEAHGQLAAWWFANLTSIGLRPGYPVAEWGMRLLGIAVQLAPLVACAVLAWRRRPRSGAQAQAHRLAAGWLGAATLGFAAISTFFDHYALPLLAPLVIAAAPMLGRSAVALAGTLGIGTLLFAIERVQVRDDATGARRVAALVQANSGGECPYVFIGDTVTYLLADACLPTPYAFTNLLAYTTEQGATGIDEAAEVRRILSARPPVIVTSDRKLAIWNRGSFVAVKAALARDYRLIHAEPRAGWRTLVYLRRDRPFRRAAPG
jgi:4-amino-4-deoxy-L-arabinose transferase-like glycosyltransferase